MELLTRQRGVVKGRLSRLQTFIQEQSIQTVSLGGLQSRKKVLEQTWVDFQTIQGKIECETDAENDDDERINFEEKFFDVDGRFNDHIQQRQEPHQPVPNTSCSNVKTNGGLNVNLPRIDLPTFEGSYESWTSFSDLFNSLVGSNTNISNVQKFQYLKSALTGAAADIVSSLPITSENYSEAWNLLSERYDHKRCIVYSHLNHIFGLSRLLVESASHLSELLNVVVKNVRALQALGQPTDQWDTWLVYFVCDKLDNETKRQWELSLTTSDLPIFQQLKTFLETRIRSLESLSSKNIIQKKSHINQISRPIAHHVSTSVKYTCVLCNDNHQIYHCPKFNAFSVENRQQTVKEYNLCYNCLRKGHGKQKCRASSCKKCHKKHHTLLHWERDSSIENTLEVNHKASSHMSLPQAVVNHLCNDKNKTKLVLLSTVVVKVKNAFGNDVYCRALLDSGSQANFITESCAQRLKLKRVRCTVPIHGIGSTSTTQSRGMVDLAITSNVSDFNVNSSAIVIEKITNNLPSSNVETTTWSHLHHLPLADRNYNISSAVDILLGAEVFSQVMCGGKVTGMAGTPTAHQTELGWVVSGGCNALATTTSISSNHTAVALDAQLKQFWELEHVSDKPAHSPEEKQCVSHFNSTHYRDETGRYVVKLPFREVTSKLGESRNRAICRLQQVERRLKKDENLRQQYGDFMQEYLELGHMEVCPSDELIKPIGETYYLPHHAVIKESSTTTKLRVVFDASAKSSNDLSLNDILMVGPKVQPELFDIILRFRLHRVAFTADIAKMYRQILMDHEDWDFQRIVWRMNSEEPIQDYRLKTVTYGTSSAPFLAINTLQQLASDEKENYPLAAKEAIKGFYVDDLMSGADTVDEAMILQQQFILMLKSAGMNLRKWSSNEAAILNCVQEEDRETQPLLLFSNDGSVKTLGLHWHPGADEFSFSVNIIPVQVTTKRTILADTARLFDPLGLLAPVVITAKILIQTLWLQKVTWDQEVHTDIVKVWNKYKQNLMCVENIRIPRYMNSSSTSRYQLVGFCDASEQAYAAVVYLRVVNDKTINTHLICAKTRVAPLKTVSLPRLELCGACLLTQLIKNVKAALQVNIESTHAWTDSNVVLCWLSGQPSRWKTFVANRVSDIQGVLSPEFWHHVRSQDNPADCASRGMTASQLIDHTLWWNGPAWLYDEEPFTSSSTGQNDKNALTEERQPITVVLVTEKRDFSTLEKFSSLSKLKRVTAFCLRFTTNSKLCESSRQYGHLTPKEVQTALYVWIKLVQAEVFKEELNRLRNGEEVLPKSNINQLAPFVDADGLLRVGGRLKNSQFGFEKKHPILLPRVHHLTNLIVSSEHLKHLHAGPQLLLSLLQQRFWILHGRDVVRRHVRKCVVCIRHRAVNLQQQMADLPSCRVQPTRPFLNCGVDFGGPFTIKLNNLRGRSRQICEKAYVALFICMSTKAIHLELVSDLTTNAFLAALRRFVARRGMCQNVYSDNATNFTGAAKELSNFFKKQNKEISSSAAEGGISWHFIPACSPHFGGLWEAGIKATKFHIRRVLGNQILNFEEFTTLLCQVEACLNSRPLHPLSSDPNDFAPLTAGHFLIGSSLLTVPEPDYASCNINHLGRWKLVQQCTQQIWKRWSNEYITQLQTRSKWNSSQANILVNDLVIIKEDNVPPSKWNIGRIIELHPGTDGKVRVVTLKTEKGVFKRPIVKLCLIPKIE